MLVKDLKTPRFTLYFIIFKDDGATIQHKYTGLNDLELAQQMKSINDVIIDLLRQGCKDTISIRAWKEDE